MELPKVYNELCFNAHLFSGRPLGVQFIRLI